MHRFVNKANLLRETRNARLRLELEELANRRIDESLHDAARFFPKRKIEFKETMGIMLVVIGKFKIGSTLDGHVEVWYDGDPDERFHYSMKSLDWAVELVRDLVDITNHLRDACPEHRVWTGPNYRGER